MNHQNNYAGNNRTVRETAGKMVLVEAPAKTWNKIEACVEDDQELVTQKTAMRLLDINTKKTFLNSLCSGRIPKRCVHVIATGLKMFWRDQLLNLKMKKHHHA